MHKHLFLTGEKQVGKSTAIDRYLAERGGEIRGFRTVKAAGVLPGETTVHMLRAGAGEYPSEDNLLFRCGAGAGPETAVRFDRLGCAALADARGAELVLMDELGPREEDAGLFHTAVLRALEGDVPVLGVLQRADSDFLRLLMRSHRAYCIEVTQENRDHVPARIRDWERLEWGASAREPEGQDSFGAVVFAEGRRGTEVLMVRSLRGWSFPKGRAFVGEPPAEAAAREIREETGIAARIDTGFQGAVASAKRGDHRQITFFCGRSGQADIPPIPLEVPDAAWVPLGEAEGRIVLEPDREVFRRAREYYGRGAAADEGTGGAK